MNKNIPCFLIVDQEKQPVLESFFQQKSQSIHCLQVQTAADCLKTILNKNVGVVVVDENLPDLSGLTLVSLLKKMKPEIEIIFTAACHDPQKEIDARLAGILYYCVKPVDWCILIQIIEKALDKQNKNFLVSHPS